MRVSHGSKEKSGRRLAVPRRRLAFGVALAAAILARHDIAESANVIWSLGDSVAACPAGDTLSTSVTRPSRLRVAVQYLNGSGSPRVGVPPESLRITFQKASGNVKANDKASVTYADDSTNAEGRAWFTIPSVSGCGALRISLTVGSVAQGNKTAVIRTTDYNADGRVDSTDYAPGAQCDLDYSGSVTPADLALVTAHDEHWRRLALHGTLVRRTNLCDACGANSPNTFGEGRSFWSPNGRWISYTIHEPVLTDVCNAYIVAADPVDGNAPQKITFATTREQSVYDPTWSPLGHQVAYEGNLGTALFRKGIPGIAADTSEQVVIALGTGGDRVVYPVFSPDGDSLAFTYLTGASGANEINTIPILGGSKRQLTFNGADDDRYPSWAVNGQMLVFERAIQTPPPTRRHLWKVSIGADDPSDATAFYSPPAPLSAKVPFYSPDSLVIFAALGTTATQTTLATFETSKTPPSAVRAITSNYPTHFDGALYAVPSPDGTRLAVAARDPRVSGAQSAQVFATRRNMSLSPQFSSIGPAPVVDSTAVVNFCVEQGNNYYYSVQASDPEGDVITYAAYLLQPWMSFDPALRRLTVAPGGTAGRTYNVVLQVTTTSGGVDRILVAVTVGCSVPQSAAGLSRMGSEPNAEVFDGPNPTRGEFSVWTPRGASRARLEVFDLNGRRVADVESHAGLPLVWNGKDRSGVPVQSGLYFYRVRFDDRHRIGRIVMAR